MNIDKYDCPAFPKYKTTKKYWSNVDTLRLSEHGLEQFAETIFHAETIEDVKQMLIRPTWFDNVIVLTETRAKRLRNFIDTSTIQGEAHWHWIQKQIERLEKSRKNQKDEE